MRKRFTDTSLFRLAVLVVAFFPGVLAYAQSGAVLEEVVVTAQKRAESIQDAPISVSAMTNETLEELGVLSVQDIVAYIPGLSGITQGGLAFNIWAIRGIATSTFGDGADTSVGVFSDDAYIGRNIIANTTAFDLQRIEVVKGPQGTLFGRNAVAGAISMHTNRPEIGENSLKIKAGAGNLGQVGGEFAANVAIGERSAV